MNSKDLVFYNEYFENIQNAKKTKEFVYNKESKKYGGEISLATKKGGLLFNVEIPHTYPLGEIKFITRNFNGYPHQNFDGSLCLNTSFVNHLHTRLGLDIERLKNYVTTYYEEEKEDIHYEYSSFDSKGLVTLIFQEKGYEASRFEKKFGNFKYSALNYKLDSHNRISKLTAVAHDLGNIDYKWSDAYKDKNAFIGAWVFIDEEPVYSKKQRFTNWSELANLLPVGFSDYFSTFCKSAANYKLYPRGLEENILLAVGYKIPNGDQYEVHWDLILLPRYDFPRKVGKASNLNRYSKPIQWDATYNSSYERFFGRGALDKNLADKKILVIGNGAVGSSLAEILTRTGVNKMDLADVDIVEPGNICRSTFEFREVSFSKSEQLKLKLQNISPFVEIELFENLKATSHKADDFFEVYSRLLQYEIIFDCTANNEIIQMLSDLKLDSTVFYLSISNKSKEMICVTNADNTNLIERRNQMLYSFGTFKEPEFREGTGCWHPTFEASFFDINQLLHFTVRRINNFYQENIKPKTFYTYFKDNQIRVSEDVKYYQPELNLELTIESSVLEKIEKNSRLHFPNEFGGILLGSYFNNNTELVISDIYFPNKFKNSPVKFEPDHKELNNYLRDYYITYSNKVIYVGDWHSHPNSTNHFSNTDFKSIKAVAESKQVNINNPILLIAAYGRDYFEPGFYVYSKNALFKFSKR